MIDENFELKIVPCGRGRFIHTNLFWGVTNGERWTDPGLWKTISRIKRLGSCSRVGFGEPTPGTLAGGTVVSTTAEPSDRTVAPAGTVDIGIVRKSPAAGKNRPTIPLALHRNRIFMFRVSINDDDRGRQTVARDQRGVSKTGDLIVVVIVSIFR
jgi:hypothetical protein